MRSAILATFITASLQAAAIVAEDAGDTARARLLGALVYSKVSLRFEETPAREAIQALREALGVSIVGRWSDDALGFGMEPDAPITLELVEVDGLSALEQILEQAALSDECTWQLRKGFVEVGTKERLAMPAAREMRVYGIRDFMIEPPQFGRLGGAVPEPRLDKYSGVMIGTPASTILNSDGSSERRKAPEDLALEIVEAIVETIEPGRWEAGELVDDASLRETRYAPASSGASTTAAAPQAVPADHWATIRLWRDQLIVKAPDFVHRQINGYPRPIPPDAAPAQGQPADSASRPAG